MVVSEIILSVEFIAAVFTLLFMGKLIIDAPFAERNGGVKRLNSSKPTFGIAGSFGTFANFSWRGTTHVVKRSLMNQQVVPRVQ